MADREVRVLILGDASSLQAATVKADANMANFETRLKSATVLSGEAGAAMGGLTGKASALNTLGFSPASAGLLGVTAGLGLAVGLVGNVIDRYEALKQANEEVTNAIEDNGYMVDQSRGILDNFLTTNRRYIDDQATVINGYADMLRAGIPIQNLQRDLSLALDVSIAKHKPLAEVIQAVTNAELGRSRGLVDMGVNVKEITALNTVATKDAAASVKAHAVLARATEEHAKAVQQLADFETIHRNKRLTPAELIQERDLKQKVADTTAAQASATDAAATASAGLEGQTNVTNAALDAASAKYKDAHTKLSDVKQAQDDLNASENDFSTRYGPAWERAMSEGIDILSLTVQLIGVLSDKTIPHLVSQVEHAFEGAKPTATPGGNRDWLNEGGTQSSGGAPIPGHHGPGANAPMNVLPVVFSPIPPNREQIAVIREQLRRMEREQR